MFTSHRMALSEFAVSLLATALLLLSVSAENKVIEISEGKVSGIKEESPGETTFYSYYGIPFAMPPVGKLRFKDPVPADSWDGVKDTTSRKPKCPQTDFFRNEELTGAEDCLYLDVFTPQSRRDDEYLPVMVCIHGGGFVIGSGRMCGPHVFIDHDVILVTIQYRLGTLGFLSTDDDLIPGNYGLKDQTLALRWVQRNIRNFGGDPEQVTIFGMSAGGASVHYQILSPHSKGLFQRAIMESGTALCPWAVGESFREVADYAASAVGCELSGQELLECLQNASIDSLVKLPVDLRVFHINPLIFGPRVDGDFIPDIPQKLVKEGRYHHVDVISGVTRHEGTLFSLGIYKDEESLKKFNSDYVDYVLAVLDFRVGDVALPSVAERILRLYTGTTHLTEAHADAVTKMLGDWQFAIPHDLTTEFLAHHNTFNKVFTYEFTYLGEHSLTAFFPSLDVSKDWVGHGDDQFYRYSFDLLPSVSTEDDIRVKDTSAKLWTNFAKTGNPTPDGSLGFTWEPSTLQSRRHLNINLNPSMEDDFREEVREFWASLPLLQNIIVDPEKVQDLHRYWLELSKQEELQLSTLEKASMKPTKHHIIDEL